MGNSFNGSNCEEEEKDRVIRKKGHEIEWKFIFLFEYRINLNVSEW